MLVGMTELNFNSLRKTPPHEKPVMHSLPVLEKIKNTYLLWYRYYQILPKSHRNSLGRRVDNLFVEMMEAVASAAFLVRDKKQPFVQLAIRKVDTLKLFLMILWETKSLDTKKYIALSTPLDEIGKMLGGWNGQLTKKTPPN